jgi:GGDEF domain-containing protein
MLVPITALRSGAHRLGEGDFGHRIDVKTADELEELAQQFNSMAAQLQETYTDLEAKVKERTRDLEAAHSTVREQADKLREQTEQLKDWNRHLEERVETQLGEIERIRRLERFLAPQVAQLIASSDGHDALLDSHRREVTVVFCDLRGFTAFTESTEPEEAMNVLREYHAALGELIFRYEGTLDRYAGDGVMILFNAPIQFADHTARAVKMAVEMRDTVGGLTGRWRNRATISASASALRSAMPRSARSASSSGSNMRRSAASPTSPPASAPRPGPARSWSAAASTAWWRSWSRAGRSTTCSSRASITRCWPRRFCAGRAKPSRPPRSSSLSSRA